MRSPRCDPKSRFGLRPQILIRALIGAGCVRVGLALSAGSGPFGASLAATAVQWISCAGSLILLALLDWDVQKHHPGIGSLFRACSFAALAGSLLPSAASLRLLFRLDGPLPCESVVLARLAALIEIVQGSAWGRRSLTPLPTLAVPPQHSTMLLRMA
jgi:hypothetical protein